MISISQTQQWHSTQSQQFKLTKTLPKCLQRPSTLHLRFRSPKDRNKGQTRFKTVPCRSGLAEDAPFAIAIGTCVLNSIVFPVRNKTKDEDGESMEDVRYAAMGIISFIPFFNWLSWVFAWLDTGRQRYLVYAIVYLAPYIRSDLSISPEDSWLPIASILVCLLHIQLEISLKSGELQDFQLFGDTSILFSENSGGKILQKQLGSLLERLQASKVEREAKQEDFVELPSVEDEIKMELEEWDEKMKSLFEDQQPTDEKALGDGEDITTTRNGLGRKNDSDMS